MRAQGTTDNGQRTSNKKKQQEPQTEGLAIGILFAHDENSHQPPPAEETGDHSTSIQKYKIEKLEIDVDGWRAGVGRGLRGRGN